VRHPLGVEIGYGETERLEAGLGRVLDSPGEVGTLELIVRRPAADQRDVVPGAEIDLVEGVVGDNWLARGNLRTPDGKADPNAQITVMNALAARLVAGDDPQRIALAGDQLYVDFDITERNLPAGSHLQVGEAVLEVMAKPHNGCAKFRERFGEDALRFVNAAERRSLRLRGMNTRVVRPGQVEVGDVVRKVDPAGF
jgi:hypothetical protein